MAKLAWFRDVQAMAAAAVGAIAAGWAASGPLGAVGMALGLTAGTVGVLGLAAAVKLVTQAGENGRKGCGLTLLYTIVFLFKLPFFAALCWIAVEMGGPGPATFVLGLLLVYCWLAGWGQSGG